MKFFLLDRLKTNFMDVFMLVSKNYQKGLKVTIIRLISIFHLPQKIDTFLLKVQLWASGAKFRKSDRQFNFADQSSEHFM